MWRAVALNRSNRRAAKPVTKAALSRLPMLDIGELRRQWRALYKTQARPAPQPRVATPTGIAVRAPDSSLEGTGFEPSVPRLMDGDLGRQVPALIAVFELAGTAMTLQRGTKMIRPDRHPEFP